MNINTGLSMLRRNPIWDSSYCNDGVPGWYTGLSRHSQYAVLMEVQILHPNQSKKKTSPGFSYTESDLWQDFTTTWARALAMGCTEPTSSRKQMSCLRHSLLCLHLWPYARLFWHAHTWLLLWRRNLGYWFLLTLHPYLLTVHDFIAKRVGISYRSLEEES